jgi:hypothetical protein
MLDAPTGLAPRALRDIKAGRDAGRFTVPDAEIALSAAAGGLLGLLQLRQRHPERIDETAVDQAAEAMLRLLGIPPPKPPASPDSPSRTPAPGKRPGSASQVVPGRVSVARDKRRLGSMNARPWGQLTPGPNARITRQSAVAWR